MITIIISNPWGFLHTSVSKESACNAGIWVQFLGWEDFLEKEMATHSNILAWRIPWTEEPSRLQPMGSQKRCHDLATKQHSISLYISGVHCIHVCLYTSLLSPQVHVSHVHKCTLLNPETALPQCPSQKGMPPYKYP